MDDILPQERRDALIETFEGIANSDLLTNMDALLIIEILQQACSRANAYLEEDMLRKMINGEEQE